MQLQEQKLTMWAIVEVMGHKRYAGLVTEQTIAGAAFVRVDIPSVPAAENCEELPAFAKLLGPSSIYALTPCTEETARAFAQVLRERAFPMYEAPRLTAIASTISDDNVGNYLSHDDDDDDNCPI